MDITKYTTGEIPLNELSNWSKWPARILGAEEWKTPNRTVEKTDKEYDKDKYEKCLKFAKEKGDTVTPEDIRVLDFQLDSSPSMCISKEEVLYELPSSNFIEASSDLLIESLEPFIDEVDTIVELGCGYGFNLWKLSKQFPDKTFRGGELSPNAVELGNYLYRDQPNITLEEMNYYDSSYEILESCAPDAKVLVYTKHSIEQLPTAENVIKTLGKYFDRIVAVVHVEIVNENSSNSVLGLMRQNYNKINDYNRDLLSQVQSYDTIEILRNDPDVFGKNPLNPTSILTWKPR